jgi:hypothetical protein
MTFEMFATYELYFNTAFNFISLWTMKIFVMCENKSYLKEGRAGRCDMVYYKQAFSNVAVNVKINSVMTDTL